MAASSRSSDLEVERYWRILQWNRLAQSGFEQTPEVVQQCRVAWRQLAAIVPENSLLPKEFLYPLRAYLRGEEAAMALFTDERRLLLCLSDLRDYLTLLRWQQRNGGRSVLW